MKKYYKHIKVNLRQQDIEDMISTYEFLKWQSTDKDDKKHCSRILKQLNKALEDNQ